VSQQTLERLGTAVRAFADELATLDVEVAQQLREPGGEWSVHDFLQRYGEILEAAVDAFQDLAAEAGFSLDDSEDVLVEIAGDPRAN
jgi:predicted ArsR family transcriptional regulator